MVFGQTLVLLLNKVKKQGSARTVLNRITGRGVHYLDINATTVISFEQRLWFVDQTTVCG